MLINTHAIGDRLRPIRGILATAIAVVIVTAVNPWAVAAPGYEDPQILTIEKERGVPAATFTAETLMQTFPVHQRDTVTPWSAGETIAYRGPYLKDILAKYGLDQKQRIEVLAFDEYMTQVSMLDIEAYNPIIAVERACTPDDRMTGQCLEGQEFTPLTIADSGPYFLVWPLDVLPDSYVPERNSMWVWFVIALRPAP